jgi:hypothetical protein
MKINFGPGSSIFPKCWASNRRAGVFGTTPRFKNVNRISETNKQLEVEVQCVKSALKGWICPSPFQNFHVAERNKLQKLRKWFELCIHQYLQLCSQDVGSSNAGTDGCI